MASNIIYVSQIGCPRIRPSEIRIRVQLFIKDVLPGQTGEGETDTKQVGEEPRHRYKRRSSCGGQFWPDPGCKETLQLQLCLWAFLRRGSWAFKHCPPSPAPVLPSVSHCSRVVHISSSLCGEVFPVALGPFFEEMTPVQNVESKTHQSGEWGSQKR